jgi:deoxyadenosine/deoxycytidine kinase
MNKKSQDYLDKINSGYLEYIKSQTELNVLIIDVSDKDFVKSRRLSFI